MLSIKQYIENTKKNIKENHPKEKTDTIIIISIHLQKLFVVTKNEIDKIYDVSTSKFGEGNKNDSFQTPLGLHHIKEKIGDDLPINTILRGRKIVNNGLTSDDLDKKCHEDFKNKHFKNFDDVITSRILWLQGCQMGINLGGEVDTFKRFIYIHGTIHEDKIGQKASHGCIRMKNDDVISLYNDIYVGTLIYITNDGIIG